MDSFQADPSLLVSQLNPAHHFQQLLIRQYSLVKGGKRIYSKTQQLHSTSSCPTVIQNTQIHSKEVLQKLTSPATTQSLAFHSLIYVNLPLYLTDDYRIRHQLSLQDMVKIIQSVPDKQLWLLALVKNYDVPCTAVQSNASAPESLAHRGGTLIQTKLINSLQDDPTLSAESRLLCQSDNHQPPLPVHFVSSDQLHRCASGVCSRPILYRWRSIDVVPFRFYRGYIQMARVFPKHIYVQLFGTSQCARSHPLEYNINGLIYCQSQETFLVQSQENYNALQHCANTTRADLFLHSYKDRLFTLQSPNTALAERPKKLAQHKLGNDSSKRKLPLSHGSASSIRPFKKKRKTQVSSESTLLA